LRVLCLEESFCRECLGKLASWAKRWSPLFPDIKAFDISLFERKKVLLVEVEKKCPRVSASYQRIAESSNRRGSDKPCDKQCEGYDGRPTMRSSK